MTDDCCHNTRQHILVYCLISSKLQQLQISDCVLVAAVTARSFKGNHKSGSAHGLQITSTAVEMWIQFLVSTTPYIYVSKWKHLFLVLTADISNQSTVPCKPCLWRWIMQLKQVSRLWTDFQTWRKNERKPLDAWIICLRTFKNCQQKCKVHGVWLKRATH